MKKAYYILVATLLFTSCNDFLDKNPDNRATLNSEEKVAKLLVSAYPDKGYQLLAEVSSDNVTDYGITKNFSLFGEDIYTWEEDIESNNESPHSLWDACYSAIAAANHALAAIEELGGPKTPQLKASKGEALLCRAYGHFILANMFCMPYNRETAANYMGLPYMDHSETDLAPKYERGTLDTFYEKMGKDIVEGIPLIDETLYAVPKYHFNYKAACCFASRYFLFTQDWDNTIKYATMALTSNPEVLLRDYEALAALPRTLGTMALEYCNADNKCNFLIQTGYSILGTWFGAYTSNNRYIHGKVQSTFETFNAKGPWGNSPTFWVAHLSYGSGKQLLPRSPYIFEVTDPVGQKGFSRALFVCFTAEEALLNRAEAYVMKMKEDPAALDNALNDMNLYAGNVIKSGFVKMTEKTVNAWAEKYNYSVPYIGKVAQTAQTLNPKKELFPAFAIDKGKTQENMLHALLFMRRYEFIHEGMRWFDTRRFGITVYRLLIDEDAQTILQITDKISDEDGIPDPRRALQLPSDVIAAGLTPNPRTK